MASLKPGATSVDHGDSAGHSSTGAGPPPGVMAWRPQLLAKQASAWRHQEGRVRQSGRQARFRTGHSNSPRAHPGISKPGSEDCWFRPAVKSRFCHS